MASDVFKSLSKNVILSGRIEGGTSRKQKKEFRKEHQRSRKAEKDPILWR